MFSQVISLRVRPITALDNIFKLKRIKLIISKTFKPCRLGDLGSDEGNKFSEILYAQALALRPSALSHLSVPKF
jgi:hypothetical protein